MLPQLAIATVMVLGTVALHGAGLLSLTKLLKLEAREEVRFHGNWRGLGVALVLVSALFALHGVEIWAYALLYLWLGAIPDLAEAVYFSTSTYATIGASDAAIASGWKLVAAIEGINGILLMGWTTAFFVGVLARLGK